MVNDSKADEHIEDIVGTRRFVYHQVVLHRNSVNETTRCPGNTQFLSNVSIFMVELTTVHEGSQVYNLVFSIL